VFKSVGSRLIIVVLALGASVGLFLDCAQNQFSYITKLELCAKAIRRMTDDCSLVDRKILGNCSLALPGVKRAIGIEGLLSVALLLLAIGIAIPGVRKRMRR
jgi:hypothetical protein